MLIYIMVISKFWLVSIQGKEAALEFKQKIKLAPRSNLVKSHHHYVGEMVSKENTEARRTGSCNLGKGAEPWCREGWESMENKIQKPWSTRGCLVSCRSLHRKEARGLIEVFWILQVFYRSVRAAFKESNAPEHYYLTDVGLVYPAASEWSVGC